MIDNSMKLSQSTKERVRLNLTPATADKLRALAKADNRTLAGYVTNLIDRQEPPV